MFIHVPLTIVIRGAGDIATGVLFRLHQAGFRRLLALECARPMAVRRKVAFSEAVYEGTVEVEGVAARLIPAPEHRGPEWEAGRIAVLVDPAAACLEQVRPDVLIEATLAKRNVGVSVRDAPLVIGLGPGFVAGRDAHRIIETQRGPGLGRVIRAGAAAPNTGIPGEIGGFSSERVLRAPRAGRFVTSLDIGARVARGEPVGAVKGEPVTSRLAGTVRGLLRSGTPVAAGTKIGDIEPRRGVPCDRISDKALAVAGGVLEAIRERFDKPAARSRPEVC